MAEKINLNNLVIDKILDVSWDNGKTWHHLTDEQSENWSGKFETPILVDKIVDASLDDGKK